MDGYAEKHNSRKVILGEAGYTTLTGGVRSQGVGRFIYRGGAGNSIVWVVDAGTFGVNGEGDRGDTHRVPATDHREDIKAVRI